MRSARATDNVLTSPARCRPAQPSAAPRASAGSRPRPCATMPTPPARVWPAVTTTWRTPEPIRSARARTTTRRASTSRRSPTAPAPTPASAPPATRRSRATTGRPRSSGATRRYRPPATSGWATATPTLGSCQSFTDASHIYPRFYQFGSAGGTDNTTTSAFQRDRPRHHQARDRDLPARLDRRLRRRVDHAHLRRGDDQLRQLVRVLPHAHHRR